MDRYGVYIHSPDVEIINNNVMPKAYVGGRVSEYIWLGRSGTFGSMRLKSGALPPGVNIRGDRIEGFPSRSGTYVFEIEARDNIKNSDKVAVKTFTLEVGIPDVSLTPAALNGGMHGEAYHAALSSTGGSGPYTYHVTSGALPDGLRLSSDGILSGTPITDGPFGFVVTSTDSSNAIEGPFSGSRAYSIFIAVPRIVIDQASLPSGKIGAVYSQTLTASGANSPYIFTANGRLPDGLVLSSDGTISGTPTEVGTFAVNFAVSDSSASGPYSTSKTLFISIGAAPKPEVAPLSANVSYNSIGTEISPILSGPAADRLYVVTQPTNGDVTVSGLTFFYKPRPGFIGPDGFTYGASNENGSSNVAAVALIVEPPASPNLSPLTDPILVDARGGVQPVPVSTDLSPLVSGVVSLLSIDTTPQYGIARIEGDGSAARPWTLIYTPAAHFMGTDVLTIVAQGPGGKSSESQVTYHVIAKAPDLTATVLSDTSITLSPTSTLVGGPFSDLRVLRGPTFGSAKVDGLNIAFTPGIENGGSTVLEYVIDLPFGSSSPGRIDLRSNLKPLAQTLSATTIQGKPVTVRVSDTVGGPFSGAAVESIDVENAGTATLTQSATHWDLAFAPDASFSGQATVTFSLTNDYGTSIGTVAVTVDARTDPSKDTEVRGLASAQMNAARRLADAQLSNFQRRLQSLHGGKNASTNGLTLNLDRSGLDEMSHDPRSGLPRSIAEGTSFEQRARSDRDRDLLGQSINSEAPEQRKIIEASFDDVVPSESSVGFWVAGGINWGRQDAEDQRDYRMTTQGATVGVDVRISENLVVGTGLGYGEDRTKIGDSGSLAESSAVTAAFYASWRPAETYYFDGILGLSKLSFDASRWAEGQYGEPNGVITSERSGRTVFASAGFGRLVQSSTILLTDLYARIDMRQIDLNGFTEANGSLSALSWGDAEQDSVSANLGASWRWNIEGRRLGQISPNAQLELSHEFMDIGEQGVRYADWMASPTYLVPLDGWSKNSASLRLGIEWAITKRTGLNVGYRGIFGDASTAHGGEFSLRYGW